MTIAHLLEDFGLSEQGIEVQVTEAMLEEERLSSFEQGYQAGWDDSTKASDDAGKVSTEEISKALSKLSISYDEAYTELLRGMRPLVESLVHSVLPKVANETLGVQVIELIHEHLKRNGKKEILICVPNGHRDILSHVDTEAICAPVRVEEDTNLNEGQIRLHFGHSEENEIDVEALLAGVSEAIKRFFENDVTTEGNAS